jgi:hypothetical protein
MVISPSLVSDRTQLPARPLFFCLSIRPSAFQLRQASCQPVRVSACPCACLSAGQRIHARMHTEVTDTIRLSVRSSVPLSVCWARALEVAADIGRRGRRRGRAAEAADQWLRERHERRVLDAGTDERYARRGKVGRDEVGDDRRAERAEAGLLSDQRPPKAALERHLVKALDRQTRYQRPPAAARGRPGTLPGGALDRQTCACKPPSLGELGGP